MRRMSSAMDWAWALQMPPAVSTAVSASAARLEILVILDPSFRQRQLQVGRMRRIVENFVFRHDRAGFIEVVAAGIEIALIGGEVAAGDLDAQAVPFLQPYGADHLVERYLVCQARAHEGDMVDAVAVTHALRGVI